MREKIGSMYRNGTPFRNDFNMLINEMMTEQEFEKEWEEITLHYGLETNSFMKQVYEVRHKWAKPYLKGNFCAKMCSTQRSECMNNVLKSYVSRSAPINCFVHQYTKLYADRCAEEDFEHGHTNKDQTIIRSNVLIEKHASKVYTRAIFKLFSLELFQSGSFHVKGNQVDGKIVIEHADAERRQRWCKVVYEVNVDRESDMYTCECGMFEHSGLLCRHILKVMVHVGARQIPSRYIMKRWTKDARDNLPEHLKTYQKDASMQVSKTFRHNIIYVKALEIVKLANRGVDHFQHGLVALDALKRELESIEVVQETVHGTRGAAAVNNTSDQPNINHKEPESGNPTVVNQRSSHNSKQGLADAQPQTGDEFHEKTELFPPEKKASKGRPKTKRFKAAGDSATRTNKCAICGSKDHFTRSCPCHLVGPVTSSDSEKENFNQEEERDEVDDQDKDVEVEETQVSMRSQRGSGSMTGKTNNHPQSAKRRCKNCGLEGHYTPKCPTYDGPKKPPKEVTCKKCFLGGHYASTCGGESSYKRKR